MKSFIQVMNALELNVNGWYGPAMNIHRGAFAGLI